MSADRQCCLALSYQEEGQGRGSVGGVLRNAFCCLTLHLSCLLKEALSFNYRMHTSECQRGGGTVSRSSGRSNGFVCAYCWLGIVSGTPMSTNSPGFPVKGAGGQML